MEIKNKSSNKSFGIVFSLFFFIIAFWFFFKTGEIKYWSLFVSIAFLVLGLMNSNILSPLNRLWFKFGIFLGNFVSPIVMGVIFFLVITPISIIMKLLGKDVLNLKTNDEKSYWIKKSEIKSNMKNQF
tara:strand:- start:1287 stop:1670 length:384 start_codon:yes stop_codon:yes gene_type:complete